MRRRLFIKQMTHAEMGETKTHEKYVRLPNDFDYKSFFQQNGVVSGSVIQIDFEAAYNGDSNDIIPLRFVYYENSNKEKRIPSLGAIFSKYNVSASDIVYLESVTINEQTTISISFKKNTDIKIATSPIYYEIDDIQQDAFSKENINYDTYQIVYYGCPGSGKSHKVKKDTEGVNTDFVFRTTFHPDTDYASFVGCYKPHTQTSASIYEQLVLDYDGLVEKFKEYLEVKPTNITKACTMFGYDYHDSIVKMQEDNIHTIPMLVADAYKSGSTYDSQVRAGMSIYETSKPVKSSEKSIVYEFCPQVFTQAYIQAWKNPDEKVYLIIEEINRGNCAQIFGDLFQLLDRKNGVSEYPVKADKDLADYLRSTLGANHEGIKNGELKLPSNLIIYATMNTSDQSLFPMDSAFKRRWDWEYVPIEYGPNKDSYNYIITIGEKEYRWVKFLEIVNKKIYAATNSEDKQMGNFFIKKSIDAATFVNKVMFYLWNEICKEEVGTSRNFFRREKDGKIEEFKFTDLFGTDRDTILNGFMANLEV